MTQPSPSLKGWLKSVIEAIGEVSGRCLGLGDVSVAPGAAQPDEPRAVLIELLGDGPTTQVTLETDEAGFAVLAHAFMSNAMGGMEMELDEEDIADAVGEVVNQIAGGVKRRMLKYDKTLMLGLPMIIDGRVRGSDHVDSEHTTVRLADTQIAVRVSRARTNAEEAA